MNLDLNIQPFAEWSKNEKRPYIIAGPCSAESENQILTTAKEIAADGKTNLFRAGIWKPRTRPGSFEGVGTEGLKWLQSVKKEYNLPVATEVAKASHVEECLKHGIDVLWIGARTTVNPFAVQEIADALKGVDIPVFVKNPINPDFNLWLGAIERLNKAGINKLAAIHRGFSAFEESPFRNIPMWDFPIKLKQICPKMPIIGDPSHISGNKELIPFLAQKMMDLDMDGMMIETHIQPKIALSDAKQQLTPTELDNLLSTLIVRDAESENEKFKSKLDELRHKIDNLDEELIQKISARMDIVQEIGKYKRDNKVTILQVSRWDEIMQKRILMAEAMGLSNKFMNQFLPLVHDESIRIQTKIMNE